MKITLSLISLIVKLLPILSFMTINSIGRVAEITNQKTSKRMDIQLNKWYIKHVVINKNPFDSHNIILHTDSLIHII
jgi:hypothetical protein